MPAGRRIPLRDYSAHRIALIKPSALGDVIQSLPVAGQPGPAQLVVERAMYSNGPGSPVWTAGTDVLATKIR